MGLLSSLFQRRTEPEGETPAPAPDRPAGGRAPEALWRCGVFESYPVGEHIQATHCANDTPRIFPSFAIEFALSCSKFRPLRKHVADYAELHHWDSLQVDALEKLLPELHDAGVLISTTDVLERAAGAQAESSPKPIRFIGFPTGGNRVALLERALRSFAENVRQHQRSIEFLVSDSSSNSEHSAAFRQRLATLGPELGFPILYAGPEEKRRFATMLVQTGACTIETAEFTLLDPLGTAFACGANRNALLLHGAGEMLCSVDDDIVCRLAAPLDEERGVACYSNTDPYSRWLFGDRESAWNAARWVDGDFLGIHEQMLGRNLGEMLQGVCASGENCDFQKTGGSFLKRLNSGAGLARATFFGHVGDPGIPTSAYYLYFDGENRSRLTESETHYRSVFGSRSVHTLVSRPSIGDASVCPGMAIGIDHRTLLPPFISVLHAEDFAWGAALWQCCGDAFLGHVPFAIQHDPGPGKSILLPSDFTESRRVVIFEWAHLLRLFILNFKPAQRQQSAERMQALGSELINYSKLSTQDFATVLAETVLEHVSSKLSWLEKQLSEDTQSPDFWREDLQMHIDHVREALTHDDFDIPLDLKSGRTPAEARAFIQKLLGNYGHLLQAWPAMVEASAVLRQQEKGLFQRIG